MKNSHVEFRHIKIGYSPQRLFRVALLIFIGARVVMILLTPDSISEVVTLLSWLFIDGRSFLCRSTT
jgi:hypothetical protein